MRVFKRIRQEFDSNRGLTILELVVAVFIFAVAITAVQASFLIGDASYNSSETKMTAMRCARSAMDNLVRELRGSRNFSVTQSTGSVTVAYDKDGEGSLTMTWQDSGAHANQVLKNGTKIIGNNITALSYIDHTIETDPQNAVTIDLTATASMPRGEDIEVTLEEKINLRLL